MFDVLRRDRQFLAERPLQLRRLLRQRCGSAPPSGAVSFPVPVTLNFFFAPELRLHFRHLV